MKMKILAVITALALVSNVEAKTQTFGIDLSGSNPLLTHKNFAHAASQYVSNQIRTLKSGDIVQIMTFGSRGDAQNLINSRITIGRRNRPEKVAQLVSKMIRKLPERANVEQSSTNLVAWLDFTDGFDCKNGSDILVITDGLESSSYISGKDLIEGRKKLPAPDVDLKGCNLTFYGLGAGWQPKHVKTVRKAWRDWSKQANASFKAIIP